MISLFLTFAPIYKKAIATRILFYQIDTPRFGREPLFRRTRPNLTDLVEWPENEALDQMFRTIRVSVKYSLL
jgi:hypothetical protein